MIEDIKTYYTCEYCGKMSQDYEEIQECEKNCKEINNELNKIIDSCNKLKEKGCTIHLREYPFYVDNKLDSAIVRRIKKEYSLAFEEKTSPTIYSPSPITTELSETTLYSSKKSLWNEDKIKKIREEYDKLKEEK